MSLTPRTTRRRLLQTAAAAAAGSALGTNRLLSGAEPKTLLILGGTRVLGPEVVEVTRPPGEVPLGAPPLATPTAPIVIAS